ncbi:MAG TPA: M28 family peptidase [Gemmataceae bacterium]|nr:M28 family peptidase [Gemmataceae bacterium]
MRTWRWSLILLAVPVLMAAERVAPAPATRAQSEARLRRDITFLASDACEGRGPGTQGINKAADYIAAQFKQAGLKPGGVEGGYFQPFTINANILDEPGRLALMGPQGQTITLKQGVQFWPMALGGSGSDEAPIVFAGYGISSKKADYDDYAEVDVLHKVVILLRGAPSSADKDHAAELMKGAPFVNKIAKAEEHGAAAVIIVNDADTARDGDDLLDFNFTAFSHSMGKIPAYHVRRSVLEMMLPEGADTLTKLEKDINRELKPHSRELPGWKVSFAVKMHRGKIDVKNIVGVLEGAGPLANETVVVGAHYDHLGYGGTGSLARSKKMAIHHGADDNASGTTTMIELARRFAAQRDRQGRRLVFIAFSGEEMGLFGSEYYCKHPLFSLKETASMFNLDMVGRLRIDKKSGKPKVLTEGCGTAKSFRELLDKLGEKHDFKMVNTPSGFGPSDHASFCGKEIPVLFVWTDYHDDYHRPSDTSDKINVEGMRRIADLSQEAITTLARMDKPQFIKVKKDPGSPGQYKGPTLGIRPSYSDEDEGLLIGGVVEGRPAANAGLKADDRIISIGGKPIKNIQTYMTVMGGHKKGETIEVGIIRDGKKKLVKVTLE